MASSNTIKDHFRETRLFTNRAIVALVVTIVLLIVLLMRLFDLQVVKHATYAVLSDQNRVHIQTRHIRDRPWDSCTPARRTQRNTQPLVLSSGPFPPVLFHLHLA